MVAKRKPAGSLPAVGLATLLAAAGPEMGCADSLGPASVASSMPAETAITTPPRLTLAFDYSVMLQAARGSADNEASSGVARAYGQASLYGSPGGATGTLTYKVENRHRYGELAPQDLGFATGYAGLPATTFSDAGTLLTNFYWQHTAANNRWAAVVGIVDVTDYVDVYAFVNPWRDFSNLVFSTNPAIPSPNQGFGIAVRAMLGTNGYILGGIADGNGDPSDPFNSVGDFFNGPETFKHLEIGYVGSFDDRFTDNVHLTLWQSDALTDTGVPSGHGAALSASWQVSDRVTPFARVGFGNGGGALYDRSAAIGFGYATDRADDVIAVGLNWSRPNADSLGPGLDDQITFETYWRFSVADRFEITPDIQYVANPALAPTESDLWYLGLRLRASF
jgi:porin